MTNKNINLKEKKLSVRLILRYTVFCANYEAVFYLFALNCHQWVGICGHVSLQGVF